MTFGGSFPWDCGLRKHPLAQEAVCSCFDIVLVCLSRESKISALGNLAVLKFRTNGSALVPINTTERISRLNPPTTRAGAQIPVGGLAGSRDSVK